MHKRFFSLILAFIMLVSSLPVSAFAAEGACSNHLTHEGCSYRDAVAEQFCDHQHDENCEKAENTVCNHTCGEECYTLLPEGETLAEGVERESDNCTHGCSVESGCITVTYLCGHTEDRMCHYMAAQDAVGCDHECELCVPEKCVHGVVIEETCADCEAEKAAAAEKAARKEKLETDIAALPSKEEIAAMDKDAFDQLWTHVENLCGAANEFEDWEITGYDDLMDKAGYMQELEGMGGYAASGTCGAKLTWALDDNGTMTISGTGAMNDYEYASTYSSTAPWASVASQIQKVVISNGVTKIGTYAFYYCDNLTEITLGKDLLVVESKSLGQKLKKVHIPDLESYCKINFKYRYVNTDFQNNTKLYLNGDELTVINIPVGITSIDDYAFRGLRNITELHIPGTVKTIPDYAFNTTVSSYYASKCRIYIADGVETIGNYAFWGMSPEEITVGKTVTSIGKSAFVGHPDSLKTTVRFSGPAPKMEDVTYGEYPHYQTFIFYYPGSEWDTWEKYVNHTDPDSAAWTEEVTWIAEGALEYAITYDANGGENPPAKQKKVTGATVALTEKAPTREGYSFLGWATTKDGQVTYHGGAPYTADANMVLYAVWGAAHTHTWSADWSSDADSHWQTCGGCDEKGSYANHIWVYATCTTPKTCSICGVTEGEAPGHSLVNGQCSICGIVPINAETFPDEIFRNYVSTNFDANNNGSLSQEEKDLAVEIDVSLQEITSLKGIEFFEKLEKLNCSSNNLTELDISKNIVLKELWCDGNKLAALDLTHNTLLDCLVCVDNQLSSLDLSNNAELTILECSNNNLTALDVSSNIRLDNLDCSDNKLTALDISNNSALLQLHCSRNQLAALDVSSNTGLWVLVCDENQLTTLDVSSNIEIINLSCEQNRITSLDLSKHTALTAFSGEGNTYTIGLDKNYTFDLSTLPGAFDVSKAINWVGGSVDGNILTVDEGVTQVTYTYDCGNSMTVDFELVVNHNKGYPLSGLSAGAILEIDGRKYTADDNGTIWLESKEDKLAHSYGSATSSEADPLGVQAHQQYPVSMEVWHLVYDETAGAFTMNKIDALTNFLTYKGTSIRMTGNQGIRIFTAVNEANRAALINGDLLKGTTMEGFKLVEYGTLFTFGTLDTTELVYDASRNNRSIAYGNGTDAIFSRQSGDIWFTGMLVNLKLDLCDDELVLRPYMILKNAAGKQLVVYGGSLQRNIGYVAYQNRNVNLGQAATNFIWNIIRTVYGDKVNG